MKVKQWQNIFYINLIANLIVQDVIQMKNRIMKHHNVSAKIMVRAKKIIVVILAHVFARMTSKIYCQYFNDCMCDEIICFGCCI